MKNIILLENGDTLIKEDSTLSEIYEWFSSNKADFEEILYLHNEKLKEIQQQKESLKNFAENLVKDINGIIQYYVDLNDCIILSREFRVLVDRVILTKFGEYGLFYIECPDIDSNYLYEITDINSNPHEIFRKIFNIYKKLEI